MHGRLSHLAAGEAIPCVGDLVPHFGYLNFLALDVAEVRALSCTRSLRTFYRLRRFQWADYGVLCGSW